MSYGSAESVRLTLKELPPHERPRERLLRHGAGSLSDAELLAILLRTGTAAGTAVHLAQQLLRHGAGTEGHGLRYLLRAPSEELVSLAGLGPAKVAQVKAALELGRRAALPLTDRVVVRGPADAASLIMSDLQHLDREQFRVILLDTKNHVLGVELVSIGTLNASLVHPREIFKAPIRRSAHAIILVHNHPSGDPTPSAEDWAVTRRLAEAGRLLGIEILDHIIVGDQQYVSLRDQGWVA